MDKSLFTASEIEAMDLIEKWAQVLESWTYLQGKNLLCNEKTEEDIDGNFVPRNEYCCLGVLREIGYAPKSAGMEIFLNVDDWQKFNSILGSQAYYSKLNDAGLPFDMIAELLRLKVENYTLRRQANVWDAEQLELVM